MRKRTIRTIEVDSQGRVVLPAGIAKRYGLVPGAKVRLEEDDLGLRFSRSSENLARVYVEPTTRCNLDCVTCMRNVWNEPPGRMDAQVYQRLLEGIRAVEPVPSVFFGGFGEPLTHPGIVAMLTQARQAGAATALITNGILLSEGMLRQLIEAGLQRLWVSLDGATPESYADVRARDTCAEGAALPAVIDNLRRLKTLRGLLDSATPRLGIAFVAMKRNIHDLPDLVRLGKDLGADQFSISNVLPHTPALRDEMLYARSFYENDLPASEWSPLIALPRMDIDRVTGEQVLQALKNRHLLSIARQELTAGASTCPFVEKGSMSVRWDGAVSPCLALLHTHDSYLDNHVRRSLAFSVGNLNETSLPAIWNDPAYRALRERLLAFDFSPCVTCNSCEMADSNQEDCFGNVAPACGGCLWAQGFIQCP
jgi:MoaA/NifB/PqqE/SkfB family radical SAM enzyme